MKKWILTIFRIQPKLGKRVAAIDEKIERIALAAFGNTLDQCAKIIYLSGYKAKLINLKIMADVIAKRLGEQRTDELAAYAEGRSAKEIAAINGTNQFTVYRRVMRSIEDASVELNDCGYDEKRMEREYGTMKFVVAVAGQLEGKLRGKRVICVRRGGNVVRRRAGT